MFVYPNHRKIAKADAIVDNVLSELKPLKRKGSDLEISPSSDRFEIRPVRKRVRYTKAQKEEMARAEELKRETEQKEKEQKYLANHPYWVWTEKNGWENETWCFYFENIMPEMETVLQSLISKAHHSTLGHEKTAITHRPQSIPSMYMMMGLKPIITCAGCTKFKFSKCKFSKDQVQKLIDDSEGGYMSAHSFGGTLDLNTLHEWDKLPEEEIFEKLYKGGIC